MKIHIMTDLEGVAGVINAKDYIHTDSKYYEYACELATLEVSAAVEGAIEAGATEVLVADGHGPGAMKRQLLHPRARLLTGRPWPAADPFGCDGTFAATMMIGQHAKSNTDGGHISHTMSFAVEEYVLNGLSLGETGLWMLVAGYFGVPVIMLSGDEASCEEAQQLVPNIEVATVKWGLKRGPATGLTGEENSMFNSVATHIHPDEARAEIRERAYHAAKRIPEIAPLTLDPPYKLTISLRPDKPGEKGRQASTKSKDLLDLMARRSKVAATLYADRGAKTKAKKKTAAKPPAKKARAKAKAKSRRRKKR